MNLADSLKSVLKNKSHHIFNDMWKEDVAHIIRDIGDDIAHMAKSGAKSFKHLKNHGLKINVKEMLESGADALLILKVLPGRVKDGFHFFREDLADELEQQTDSKHKKIFALKVFGALTSFTVGSIYSVKKSAGDFSIKGLKRKNAFTQFIIAEIIFKISQLFIHKFLTEAEKLITDEEDLKNVRYFKELISDRSQMEANAEKMEEFEASDPAIRIVENLRNYIMTGKRLT
jgi:hypothetical protein